MSRRNEWMLQVWSQRFRLPELGRPRQAQPRPAVLDEKPLKAVKAKPPDLSEGMTAAAAFQAIGGAHLRHLVANERLLHESRDPCVFHQMRVAIRRLRAAMSLFKNVIADDHRDVLRSELKWAASDDRCVAVPQCSHRSCRMMGLTGVLGFVPEFNACGSRRDAK